MTPRTQEQAMRHFKPGITGADEPSEPGARINVAEPRPRLNLARQSAYTYIGIGITIAASAMLLRDVGHILEERVRLGRTSQIFEQVTFIGIVYFLIYGNLVYQLTRLGYLRRRLAHKPLSRATLERIYDQQQPPSLTVLVPSYCEERRVVRQALLSGALMEYPGRRLVLLIDDPPSPSDPSMAAELNAMRSLPQEIEALLEAPARRFAAALSVFLDRKQQGALDNRSETLRLVRLYRHAAAWLERLADSFRVENHTDALFLGRVLREPAQAHRARAAELMASLEHRKHWLSVTDFLREYRRLATLFRCELTSFERKRYVNLSHAANKAMNLNSFIGLIGKSFHHVIRPDRLHLEQCDRAVADFHVPDTDYLITLDADSLLLNDYAMRLINVMEQPENMRVAIAQTPYSAVPGTPNLLERVAGATTDIQHIIHQGFTAFSATYWVGANAMLRRAALEDICEYEEERGYRVAKYVQDHTVIEDTESSIDLVARGWHLYNYPDRLAYSATPPDFGALIIQRRRWANGGLLILPKLLRYLLTGPGRLRKLAEGFVRFHYLTSLTAVSVGMLFLLFHPFDRSMYTYWLPLTAAAYYALYGLDLVDCGYSWVDLFRVYALNLLLIPINLGGVLKSLHQGCTGRKTPFGRTPKIQGRTAAPSLYVVSASLLPLFCIFGAGFDVAAARWDHAAFLLLNGGFFVYALLRFVGWRQGLEDISVGRAQLAKASAKFSYSSQRFFRLLRRWHDLSDGVSAITRRVRAGSVDDSLAHSRREAAIAEQSDPVSLADKPGVDADNSEYLSAQEDF